MMGVKSEQTKPIYVASTEQIQQTYDLTYIFDAHRVNTLHAAVLNGPSVEACEPLKSIEKKFT
jgi:hypothetical protein